jgi:hypothetical protein
VLLLVMLLQDSQGLANLAQLLGLAVLPLVMLLH